MASPTKLSYQRLRNTNEFEVEEEGEEEDEEGKIVGNKRIRCWPRIRKVSTGKRRPRVQIPRIRKYLRKKVRLFSFVRVLWGKALKRWKESRAKYFGDLFAANYVFMHVNPTSLKSVGKSLATHDHFHELPSTTKYSIRKI